MSEHYMGETLYDSMWKHFCGSCMEDTILLADFEWGIHCFTVV